MISFETNYVVILIFYNSFALVEVFDAEDLVPFPLAPPFTALVLTIAFFVMFLINFFMIITI